MFVFELAWWIIKGVFITVFIGVAYGFIEQVCSEGWSPERAPKMEPLPPIPAKRKKTRKRKKK